MFTKKFTKVFTLVVLCLLGTVVSVLAGAWGNHPEAPYQGGYWKWQISGPGIVSEAYSMKWSQSAIDDMKWDGNTEVLDQTADCTVASPAGDKLHTQSSSSNIPNTGINGYNDCGVYQWFEESELKINPHSLNTSTQYWQRVNWQCVDEDASGDLNVSFEAAPWHHGWLDKESYSCGSSSASSGNELNDVDKLTIQNEPILLREVDNGIFSYQVIRKSNGNLRVYSDVDFLEPQTFEAYKDENERLLNTIILGKAESGTTLAVVTFISPLTVEEARAIAQNADIEVISYSVFGHLEDDIVSTYMFPQSRTIEDTIQIETNPENMGEIINDGVMTIMGYVDSSGLQLLNSYENIALLDVTASRIQSEIRDLDEVVDLQQFAIPNPAWQIYAGEIGTTE